MIGHMPVLSHVTPGCTPTAPSPTPPVWDWAAAAAAAAPLKAAAHAWAAAAHGAFAAALAASVAATSSSACGMSLRTPSGSWCTRAGSDLARLLSRICICSSAAAPPRPPAAVAVSAVGGLAWLAESVMGVASAAVAASVIVTSGVLVVELLVVGPVMSVRRRTAGLVARARVLASCSSWSVVIVILSPSSSTYVNLGLFLMSNRSLALLVSAVHVRLPLVVV